MTAVFGSDDCPAIAPMFRLQWEQSQGCYVLLYPEGMVRLNGPAGEILSRCDGSRSVSRILDELMERFPEAQSLEPDLYTFLSTAHERQWIRFRRS